MDLIQSKRNKTLVIIKNLISEESLIDPDEISESEYIIRLGFSKIHLARIITEFEFCSGYYVDDSIIHKAETIKDLVDHITKEILVSKCCNEKVTEEITSRMQWYICDKCNMPCDVE